MPSRGKESYSIQSVENALDVLEALCDEGDEVRITRLSEKLGMNKTSVFRLLATFENRGYVEKEAESGRYRLGLSAYEIGQKFLSRMGLLRMAKPVMERLVRECNEAVYLTVRREKEILFLDLVDTGQQVKIISLLGKRFPVETTSPGRLYLAYPPAASGGNGKDRPDKALFAVRQQGFCSDTGSLGEGITSLAVPLFGAGGEITGCLCMVGPDFRLTSERIEKEFLPPMQEAGRVISSKLGYLL